MLKPRRRFPPKVLSPNEVAAMLSACSSRPTCIRNRALIVTLYRAGLRIIEALSLRPKNLDPVNGAIRVLTGKGGKSRNVGMDLAAWEYVNRGPVHRDERGIGDDAPPFCMHDGWLLSTSSMRRLLHRLVRAAGIAKRVHPHGLRHTRAAELRAEGIDIGIISKQTGHRSIATTAWYLDQSTLVAVIGVMRKRRWWSAGQSWLGKNTTNDEICLASHEGR